jgi:hypothetical protein
MTRTLTIAIAAVALMGCKDKGACLETVTTTVLMPMLVGKMTVLMPITQARCRRWEFPEGRP